MAAAYAARKLGVPATIIVPASTPQLVVERLKDEGATVRIAGKVRCDGMKHDFRKRKFHFALLLRFGMKPTQRLSDWQKPKG